MRILNCSRFPTSILRGMIRFLEPRFKHSKDVRLIVEDASKGHTSGGQASYNPQFAPQVTLLLPGKTASKYPWERKHVDPKVAKIAGSIDLHSWEEEVFKTLAHELHHVEEMRKGILMSPKSGWRVQSEARAERAAFKALRAYRKERSE